MNPNLLAQARLIVANHSRLAHCPDVVVKALYLMAKDLLIQHDADQALLASRERYHALLARAIRNAKTPATPLPAEAADHAP